MVIVDDLVQTGGTLIECAKVGINKLITGGGGGQLLVQTKLCISK